MPENRVLKYLDPDATTTSQTPAKTSIININTTNIIHNIVNIDPSEGRQRKAMGVLTEYVEAAMRKAVIEQLSDGTWYANIPPCPGVWANEETPEFCKGTLREVLEGWLLLKLRDNDPLEEIDGIDLKVVEETWDQ